MQAQLLFNQPEGAKERAHCLHCNEPFLFYPSSAKGMFCSKGCHYESKRTIGNRITCTVCKKRQPLTGFYKDSSKPCGYDKRCKSCVYQQRKGQAKEERECQQCGEPFQAIPSSTHKYCCRPCYWKSKKDRAALTCSECGEHFTRQRSRIKGEEHNFCSAECHRTFLRDQVELECKVCGDTYTVPPSQVERSKYCSTECQYEAKKTGQYLECQHCGDIFWCVRRGSSKYCSSACYWASMRPEGVTEKPTLECERCSMPFEVSPSQIGKRKYCNEWCRKGYVLSSGQNAVLRVCESCEEYKPPSAFPTKGEHRRSSCQACIRKEAREYYHTGGSKSSSCATCGETFKQHPWQSRQYCSRECFQKRNHPVDGKKPCTQCGRVLPVEMFYEHPYNESGLWSKCKDCALLHSGYRRKRLEEIPGEITLSAIHRLWRRQRGLCFWCGAPCGNRPADRSAYHVDHLTPISREAADPSNHPRNLAVTCQPCNSEKYNKLPIEYKAYRLANGAEKTYAQGTTISLPQSLRGC